MGYRVGEQAGPYEVLELLGRGTFGEVLLVRDLRLAGPGGRMALKTVSCDQLSGEAADRIQDSALAEAQLLMRLKHPHIVRCHEAQWDGGRHVVWLALELMEGGDVQSLIDGRRQTDEPPFEPHFVRRVLTSVGSALQYVHGEGVLHRDVKPANVLLTRHSQRIKLGDFGISKLLEATGRARTVVGTPYYLAPEIVSGQAYGPAADGWALGVCLFELAALQRPFEAANPLALVRRICEEPPLGLPAETAPDVSRAIIGLLDRDPARRLTLAQALSVSEAVAALAACSNEHETSQACSPRYSQAPQGDELSPLAPPPPPPPRSQDVSPVSMATTVSGCGSSPSEAGGTAEIVATLCGLAPPPAPPPPPPPLGAPQSWHGSEAMAHAKAALGADVDDPEELQIALLALEGEAPEVGEPMYEAFEALSCELRLRIAALRADAAALLQSLLDAPPRAAEAAGPQILGPERTAFALPAQWVHLGNDLTVAPDTVTTLCNADVDEGEEVAAIETAIELASSLGVDTGPAEERAASARGLLSLRIAWGSFTCFLLLPLGVSFNALLAGVARRFGFNQSPSGGGPSLFELWHREGSEFVRISDQTVWEACLQRRGLYARPGRLELRLEAVAGLQPPLRRRVRDSVAAGAGVPQAPFVVTGTRLFLPCSGKQGKSDGLQPLPFLSPPPPSWTGRKPSKEQSRRSQRPPLPTPARGSRPLGAPRETGRLQPQLRRSGRGSATLSVEGTGRCSATQMAPKAPLELEGHAPRRPSGPSR